MFKLKGKRTGIGFVVGTALVIVCIIGSWDEPKNFSGLLFAWMTVFGVFSGKNLMEGKIKKPEVSREMG